ncbi:protein-tyrosine phosphatase family protein [Actinoplanes sp. URMC 104]|uniref:protein-tyrosine phosphatase family protein n=1 Tax=Actinoplanes sp. URMC 104 TaxID=3423409 RepID=UPI003F1B427D
MRAALHVIAGPGPGQLATIAHPRTDAWAPQQLGALARAGVDVLVSALTTTEQHRLGFGDTAAAAEACGLQFVSFPVPEGGVPRDEALQVVDLAGKLAGQVRAGRFVVTQCFGGIGRSTLLACTTLVLLGIAPGEALSRVTGGTEMPVTQDWLYDFAASHPSRLAGTA